ncbi:hypothetical protein NE237_008303 [Protea cynaroides]|uniref:Uncharacterized protein n=1 Tax=Protea cynaroides TaxID=273540 RepID=A0A9Q0GNJ7_9MAGN|nr:hypothetical protein NE237_008303 [Protea cynaroides]
MGCQCPLFSYYINCYSRDVSIFNISCGVKSTHDHFFSLDVHLYSQTGNAPNSMFLLYVVYGFDHHAPMII